MSDFWNKPRSLRAIAGDLVDQLPDDEIGGDTSLSKLKSTTSKILRTTRLPLSLSFNPKAASSFAIGVLKPVLARVPALEQPSPLPKP